MRGGGRSTQGNAAGLDGATLRDRNGRALARWRATRSTGSGDNQHTNLARTIAITKEAFAARGLHQAWERVIAVVVQPGVEFGNATVIPYDASRTKKLAAFAAAQGGRVYEAHSTDYQTPGALKEMVRDHFAILKVGPWMTFAYREAVFALEAVEKEWLGAARGTPFPA